MCGIAGFLDPAGKLRNPNALIETMLSALKHRGPDDWGSWTSEDFPVTLGHRRLSILDTSDSGRQPFSSPSGRYQLTYNGEVYNFKDIRRELGDVKLTSSGDTAAIAAAFDHWGIMPAIERFNGMFAIGVWDRELREFTLIRDRLGKKPVYYGLENGVFAFSSELKPLHSIDGFCNDICPVALEELLKFGYISSPRSIFKTVQKLKAGERLTLSYNNANLDYTKEQYWEPTASEASELPDSPQEFLEMLDELLTDSVRVRMISDVPLGAFLSGGIDSSLVCALMAKVGSGPVKTFSIGFSEEEFNEATYAKKVAKHLETDHQEQYLSASDSLKLVNKIPSIYTEPFADPSQLPTYLVSQLARKDVTVALSGDGGDELFSGYSRYETVLTGWLAKNSSRGKLTTSILNAAGSIAPGMTSKAVLSSTGRKGRPLGCQKKFRREMERRNASEFTEYYRLNNSAYKLSDSLLSKEFREQSPSIQNGEWSEFGSNRVKMSRHDLSYYLPEDILAKVDRASMAVSLETRNPILDYRLVSPSLAALDKYPESANPKWALKTLLARYIPKQYFDRPKQGFGVPIHQWMANELRPWVEELISSDRIQRDGYFDHEKVTTVWNEFLLGDDIAWGVILWRLVMFQAWHQTFFSHQDSREVA